MQENFKILFIGDIVGKNARLAVRKFLQEENNLQKYDFVIANAENASHGFGLTKKNHDELLSYGINCLTSGNHIWDKKDILMYISETKNLVRPYNYHKSTQGTGYLVFDNIIVANFLGKTFMPPIDCPFVGLENLIAELKQQYDLDEKIFFIDFHAEATAEKQCFAQFASELGVNCVIGTHTHVQTADEMIINGTCAYLTDVGFCGSRDSAIGMEFSGSIKKIITSINERFEVETSMPVVINACEVEFEYNKPVSIKRINISYEKVGECENEA